MKKAWTGVGVVGGAIALVLGGQFFASRAAAREVDKAIDSVSEFVDIDYQKVSASLLGRGTRVKGVVDDSFMQRMFDTTAEANGTSVKAVKQDLIDSLSADPEMAKMLGEEQLKEMQKFIDDPDGFTISFSPQQPVPFSNLMASEGSGSLLEQLNIRFKAN